MLRNIVLVVATLAVLAVILIAYTFTAGTAVESTERQRDLDDLPASAGDAEPVRYQDVEIPPGGEIIFERWDARTGRVTDVIRCLDWKPAQGSNREIILNQPELELLLPSGMIAVISADLGQLGVDRIQQTQMQPKQGWLDGNVRIVLDRATSLERTPREERPDDLLTVSVDHLDFDLDLGTLDTDDSVSVTCREFEIAGTGLNLVWNQADNRVESLVIEQGEQFTLRSAGGLIAATGQPEVALEGATSQPAKKRRRRAEPATSYLCTLSENVAITQERGDRVLGGLKADKLELVFDIGGRSSAALAGTDRTPATTQPTSQPIASQPADAERDCLIVRWTGPLRLRPTGTRAADEPARRWFTATGSPVLLQQGQRTVRCGRLEYHDETQYIWLSPVEGDTVEFGLGGKLSATAADVFVDRVGRIVKLLGDVVLRSRGGAGDSGSSIRCGYWAELHLAGEDTTETPPTGEVFAADQIESARFVGDVQVALNNQLLAAHELDVQFRPTDADAELDAMLDTATASGFVHLAGDDGDLDCTQLELAFAYHGEGQIYPRDIVAIGDARITSSDAALRGDRITAALAPPIEAVGGGRSADFVLRSLDIDGRAEFVHRAEKIAARGAHFDAEFTGANKPVSITVHGTPEALGLVHYDGYTVRGEQIDLDARRLTLDVAGTSEVEFKSRRSLQGARRSRAGRVKVVSHERMQIDARGNMVRFVGDVRASSGDEALQSETLTLRLADKPEESSPTPPNPLRALLREMRSRLLGSASTDDPFAIRFDEDLPPKEPSRLLAANALITSETHEPDSTEPVLHASISAPLLEVDIVRQQIFTTGKTQLLMVDRRGLDDPRAAPRASGFASALVSRGPSQTAMQCDGRMTYSIGSQEQRRDSVLFEDDVYFVHRTGREMLDLETMMPDVQISPELLDSLQSRNATLACERLEGWFAAGAERGGLVGGALTGSGLELASLTASDSVYLRDQEGTRIREINADWIEFNREQGRVDVRGTDEVEARVYLEDTATQSLSFHYGRRVQIDLINGTIQSDEMTGQVGG